MYDLTNQRPRPSQKLCDQFSYLIEFLSDCQTDPDHSKKSEFDWWSKYYYSCHDERRTQAEYVNAGHDKLMVSSHLGFLIAVVTACCYGYYLLPWLPSVAMVTIS